MVFVAQEAAEILAKEALSWRSLICAPAPARCGAIVNTVKKTNKVIVLHET